MDLIDASNNNNNSSSSQQQEQTNTFCPSCDGKMLYVTKGNLAENYVCESCGTTIDPKVEYVKHESDLIDMSDDESDPDMLSIVQKQDPPKYQGPTDWVDKEMKAEIEKGGRKQVVSISANKSSNNNEAFGMKGSAGINRIERPKK